ncbi:MULTISPECIES: 6,7-dimethyl-8-ribityllumazine synthase [unclassified Curtobacterium]|uniref:6,7-dimethyl-8-ribityllumazine synthase n=1 Tax=unclassified Curtobacterium TaxID=257496 RepID=UPI000DA7BCF7|nr:MULTISPECIES: 6,7-dimethyl-8-ribityllumazine synthase [unclassified Curtobacterium]PZE26562.1 6,7-dimethyl-8-ribityllumazine synthase [Curtobacterium sp. MCBD17_028]PZE74309.1 6,7-dimethyl-8-ribityllumazine synthase [Curtobacterium sp. MCBD17_019]PZF58651.1 6,7-dimethyl-8-ribityllumazine synthase [Curtobacterium sp. MCBD17_034]PZF64299.1 6,7-dimethyl-8-ribityllumazine synthase [Curtobacterium sp. MCBD17_013]PZM34641.1 6,7-dimethyl-8-ribityllumazine synthase [Curtobacterium sp. MCBD17_031]
MSGAGAAERDEVDGTGVHVAIVAGRWHETIAGGLLQGALREAERLGASTEVIHVPGSFELPVVAKAALVAGADAAVALGVVIRGGTPHFEYVSDAATSGLVRVALDTGKPVGFGVLTLDDEQQGLDRAGLPGSKEDKGAEALHAAVSTAVALRGLHRRA